ncbi:hypothetical protein BT69DRAFT_835713 [Atractiella rhizophila]|nr:hypothetical protein BT69DRAFT_835713 [Atractiella rhizophila]
MLPAGDIVRRTADILREIENPKQDGTFQFWLQVSRLMMSPNLKGGLVRAEAGEVMREIKAREIEAQNQEGNLVRVGRQKLWGK